MIDILRRRLAELESEAQFAGRPYPDGIEPFPKTLIGQGFFPGGDGLWRDADPPSKLKEPSPYPFPKRGIMYRGNDFGSLSRFQKLRLHENPPTWRHLRHRIQLAGIQGELGFFTNAFLGLRSDRSALASPVEDEEHKRMSAEFLDFQVSCQEPRLIVVLGKPPSLLLQRILPSSGRSSSGLQLGSHRGREIGVLAVSHPYSDIGKKPEAKQAEADRLRDAWSAVVAR